MVKVISLKCAGSQNAAGTVHDTNRNIKDRSSASFRHVTLHKKPQLMKSQFTLTQDGIVSKNKH